MEDKVEENENLCGLLGETITSCPHHHENSNIQKEIQILITEISAAAAADDYHNDIIKRQNDQKLMSEIPQIESDACRHQKVNLGKTFYLNCSQESPPKIPVRRYSSAESAFHKLTVNEQIQNEQRSSIELNESLLGICESGSQNCIRSGIEPKLIESEIALNAAPRISPDKDISSTRRRYTQREQANTSNHPCKLTVEDKYLNHPLPEPVFRDADIQVSQTSMPTPQVFELCQSTRNQSTEFYFPIQSSLDQDSPQEFDENLFGIYGGGDENSVHSRNEPNLIDSETIVTDAARNIPGEVLSCIQRRDTQREQTNASHDPYKLTVEDKYLNIYNIDRRDPPTPKPVFLDKTILVSETLMPTTPVLELCESTRNRPKKFYFSLEKSSDQDLPQGKLPLSKLIGK